ncbi:MAG: hypothetical protein CMI03_10370 [Oceanospirillaceae bacterium]|nr:hypothetical protein [Oceanospirillaceae bacterium]MBS53137.1 hypothetical protein [Oceanospirillaceae bacterium]
MAPQGRRGTVCPVNKKWPRIIPNDSYFIQEGMLGFLIIIWNKLSDCYASRTCHLINKAVTLLKRKNNAPCRADDDKGQEYN